MMRRIMTTARKRKEIKEVNAWKEDLWDVIKTFAQQSNGMRFVDEELFLEFALRCEKGEF